MQLNFTPRKKILTLLTLLLTCALRAQTPTIESFTPTVVTQRTAVVITGNNFTGATASNVRFGGVPAVSITVNSNNQITAIVGNGASGNVTVINNGITANLAGLTYIAPANTGAVSRITRVITNFNGYWNSAAASDTPALQPDTSHSLMGFEYGGVVYSTGSNTATSLLNANDVAFTPGNYRALPVRSLSGNVVQGGQNPTLIALGSKIDGNPNARVPGAPAVAGLSVRDVLIDGIRGLDLGTGVTNLPSTSVLLFNASNILSAGINDAVPDILVSQIATPSDGSYSIYSFVDANGNIVGNPVQIALNSVPAVGRYKSDFFTLQNGALNTSVVNGSTTIGLNTRDIRMVAYKLSDFGITDANKDNAVLFKVMPSGTSDPAFMAYNRDTFQIPSPIITQQPASQVACTGQGNSVTFTVGVTGEELTYQWEKNGVDIPGATGPSLTLNNVQNSDIGAYRVLITNPSGAALSTYAYLNTLISTQPLATPACLGTPVELQTIANGLNIGYQWYSNTANNNTSGTLIPGATSGKYLPPVDTAGTIYYYAVVSNNGQACATATTNAVAVTVNGAAVAGTATGNTIICPGLTAQVSVTGSTGTIQWQQSTNGTNGWVNVTGGSGGTTATYTTPALTATLYYRAVVSTTSPCPQEITNRVTVRVEDTLIWNGSVDTNWHVPGNWSCNSIPTLVDNVIIPQTVNQPVVFSGTTALGKTLSVQQGAILTINPANNIQILDNITVDAAGEMIVSSTANLVQDDAGLVNQNTGKVTVKRQSSELFRLDYTLWSSPVSGQNIFQFSPATTASRFYTFNTGVNLYDQVTNLGPTSTSTFQTGVGYLIRMPNGNPTPGYNNGTVAIKHNGEFKGVPHNGTITLPVSLAGERYNGTGNPYPSAINVWNFIDANTNNLALGTLYFWRKKNNNANSSYASLTKFAYNPNGAEGGDTGSGTFTDGQQANWVINPGQGFIVRAATGATAITFTNAMRREVNNNQFFRQVPQGVVDASRFWLGLTSAAGASSQVVIGYSATTTNGLDYGWDGEAIGDNSVAVFTQADGTNLSIEARAPFANTDVVALHYTADAAGQYTFTLTKTDGIFAGAQDIYLKDNLSGTTHDIKEGAYTFSTGAGTFDDRFEVMYTQAALSTGKPVFDEKSIIVYKQGNDLHVDANTEIAGVRLYDTRGRLVHEANNINALQAVLRDITVAEQVLIVQVTTTNSLTVNKKVIF